MKFKDQAWATAITDCQVGYLLAILAVKASQ